MTTANRLFPLSKDLRNDSSIDASRVRIKHVIGPSPFDLRPIEKLGIGIHHQGPVGPDRVDQRIDERLWTAREVSDALERETDRHMVTLFNAEGCQIINEASR